MSSGALRDQGRRESDAAALALADRQPAAAGAASWSNRVLSVRPGTSSEISETWSQNAAGIRQPMAIFGLEWLGPTADGKLLMPHALFSDGH